jgi:tRNA nucleotidyltransferase (CCA-adding enzyme)
LFSAIHPALPWDDEVEARYQHVLDFEPDLNWQLNELPDRAFLFYAVWLVALDRERAIHIAERLSFPGALRQDILAVCQLWSTAGDLDASTPPSEFVNLFEAHPERVLVAIWLSVEGLMTVRSAIEKYLSTWRYVTPSIDGDVLRARGLKPGPHYTQILGALRDAWLDGKISSQEDEGMLLESMLEEIG